MSGTGDCGAGEPGGVVVCVRNSGKRSNREVTRSSRSIRLSSSEAGLWAAAAASASLPVKRKKEISYYIIDHNKYWTLGKLIQGAFIVSSKSRVGRSGMLG